MKYVISILVLVLLLVGCTAPINETQEVDNLSDDDELRNELDQVKAELDELKEKVDNPPEKPVEPEVEEPVIEDPAPKLSRDMIKILEKIEGTTEENYVYYYIDPVQGPKADHIFVRDNLIKIELFDGIKTELGYMDTVFLDRTLRTSKGFCLSRGNDCPDGEGPFPADYDEYIIRTPLDWAKLITEGDIVGHDSQDERPITVIETFFDEVPAFVSLDSFYGLPLEIRMNPESKAEKTYRFYELFTEEVKLADVTPPTA